MMTGDLPVRLTPSLKLISSSPPVMEPTDTRTELRPIRLFLSAPRSLQSTAQDNLLLDRERDRPGEGDGGGEDPGPEGDLEAGVKEGEGEDEEIPGPQ